MNNDIIPVFFSTDNNFAVPTYMALFSMLYNYRGEADILVFILTAEDFSKKNIFLFNSLLNRFKNFKIKIINVKNTYDNVPLQLKHLSKAALFRLSIPRIADSLTDGLMEKCIYLDSDLLIEGDISELFNLDINGYYLGEIKDMAQIFEKNTSFKEKLGIPSLNRYINSGVLLYNLTEINNSSGLRERLEQDGYKKSLPYCDQDIINSVLYRGIKLFPLKYNVMTRDINNNSKEFYDLYGDNNIIEARMNPFIIHYITGRKPWIYRDSVMAEKWWKYVSLQNKNINREYIKPFIKTHRPPFYQWIKDRLKFFLKRHGIYQLIKGQGKRICEN